MNLAQLALQDQVDTVNHMAELAEDDVAACLGRNFRRQDTPGTFGSSVRHFLGELLLAGAIRPCAHLVPGVPGRGYWNHWASDALDCGDCAPVLIQERQQAIPCDRCGSLHPSATVNGALIPSRVVDVPDREPKASPAIHVRFVLCPGCQAQEDA